MSGEIPIDELMNGYEIPEEWFGCFDRETGQVLTFEADLIREAENAMEEGLGDESWARGSPWEEDVNTAVRSIAAGTDAERYVELPSKFDFHEYRRMEEFIETMPEGDAKDQLEESIIGKRVFRRFKDTAQRLGVIDRWYAFRNVALERFLRRWAQVHDIVIKDAPTGE